MLSVPSLYHAPQGETTDNKGRECLLGIRMLADEEELLAHIEKSKRYDA